MVSVYVQTNVALSERHSLKQNVHRPLSEIEGLYVWHAGADPGFQVRGGALKIIAPSRVRREHFLGISCEKSQFYPPKNHIFSILEGRLVHNKLNCVSSVRAKYIKLEEVNRKKCVGGCFL